MIQQPLLHIRIINKGGKALIPVAIESCFLDKNVGYINWPNVLVRPLALFLEIIEFLSGLLNSHPFLVAGSNVPVEVLRWSNKFRINPKRLNNLVLSCMGKRGVDSEGGLGWDRGVGNRQLLKLGRLQDGGWLIGSRRGGWCS